MLSRNSADFPSKITTRLAKLYEFYNKCKADKNKRAGYEALLRYYQYAAKEFIIDPEYGVGKTDNSRGLLIYHKMGLGKTRLAASILVNMLSKHRQGVVIMPQYLRQNFVDTVNFVINAVGARNNLIDYLRFISLDAYNMADQLTRNSAGSPLDNKILIIDEAHNFFRGVVNSSDNGTNARKLYNLIMNANNLRIVFLTGTPIVKNPFELVPCINMLAGYDVLPAHYENFVGLFVDETNGKIKNRSKLSNRMLGMVSCMLYDDIGEDANLPELLPTKIDMVEMSEPQYKSYLIIMESEKDESRKTASARSRTPSGTTPGLSLPSSERRVASTYHVKSRAISLINNIMGLPVGVLDDAFFTQQNSPKMTLITERLSAEHGLSLVYSQFVDNGLKALSRYMVLAGFIEYIPITPKTSKGLKKQEKRTHTTRHNKKLSTEDDVEDGVEDDTVHTLSMAVNVDDIGVDEEDVNWAADDDVEEDVNGAADDDVEDVIPVAKGGSYTRYFAVIHGEVAVIHRKEIVEKFTSPENKHGKFIKVLLISKTGAEGLDLKNIRNIHIMEPYWEKSREDQVMARGVRVSSHMDLPPSERNVQPYLYIAVKNKPMWEQISAENRDLLTIDEMFHYRALDRQKINNEFRNLFREVSIECQLLTNNDGKCRGCKTCNPEKVSLYSKDIYLDITRDDPCQPIKEKSVAATKIIYNDAAYYYTKLDDGDYEIYKFDDKIGSYVVVDNRNVARYDIIDFIEKTSKKNKR